MADNFPIKDAGDVNRTMALDDVSSVFYPWVKLDVGGDGASAPVSNTNPVPVRLATAATSTLANVSASTSSVTLQASNANRRGLVIFNDSTNVLHVKYGTTASTTSFTHRLQEGESLVMGWTELYTGIVTGIWDGTNGAARMTELTA